MSFAEGADMAARSRWRVRRAWLLPVLLSTVVVVLLSAAAAAATETNTVHTFWRGLWWSLSLITTVGFIGQPPSTVAGATLSVALMVIGFLLLAMVSASLAAIFVGDEERPRDVRDEAFEQEMRASFERMEARLLSLERQLTERTPDPPG